MKKIVLRDLSTDIKRVIRERAKERHVSRAEAVVGILDDAAIESIIKHDVALLESWFREDGEEDDELLAAADEELFPFDEWDEEEGAFF